MRLHSFMTLPAMWAVSSLSISLPTVAIFWFSVFLTIIILMQMKLHLTVILIYISLVSNKDEHVPVYLKKKK